MDGERKPMILSNVSTDPFHFPPPSDYGKSDPFGGAKFKSFRVFPPQSNSTTLKHNEEDRDRGSKDLILIRLQFVYIIFDKSRYNR